MIGAKEDLGYNHKHSPLKGHEECFPKKFRVKITIYPGENRPKKPNISQGISERSPTLFTPWIEEAPTFKLPLAEQLTRDAQRRHVQ